MIKCLHCDSPRRTIELSSQFAFERILEFKKSCRANGGFFLYAAITLSASP
jgi:hypothetical protein